MKRIAIVHDWLTVYAGAERVLEQLLLLFPAAELYCVCDFVPDTERQFLAGRTPKTTFIQSLPFARTRYRQYLPLMPLAIEQHDLSSYDVVISSSHAVAKGVLTGPDQLHISYVHSPIRYAWDLHHQYLRESGLASGVKGWFAKWALHRIRTWDLRTANGVDQFLANSEFIARRIWKTYRRDSIVVPPPVDLSAFQPSAQTKADFFLTASRLVPYKRIDLIVSAFKAMPDKRLKVIGDGPEKTKIEALARDCPNIELLGYQPSARLQSEMQAAACFVFAAEEDFGIMPVEAQACGTPVIAYGKGGALETVKALGCPQPTGLFFGQQTVDSIQAAVRKFEENRNEFTVAGCRTNAEKFSLEGFRQQIERIVCELGNDAERSR